MNPITLVNGIHQEHISTQDRGLQYGDGFFETIAVYQKSPLNIDTHLRRLAFACDSLGFNKPDLETIESQAKSLINENCAAADKAVLKISYTRGVGGRGYKPPKQSEATTIISLSEWPTYPDNIRENGIKANFSQVITASNPLFAGIKHLNRLEQVVARDQMPEDCFESIMLDIKQQVIEGTMSNLFMVIEDLIITPDLKNCGIDGIIRNEIIHSAHDIGYSIRIDNIRKEDLFAADEVFFSNSLMGIVPANMIEETVYTDFSVAREINQHLVKHSKIVPL